MIKVTADGTFNRVNLDIEIERLERLQADLRRLRDGGYPTTEEIRTAPRIDRWKSAGRQVTCLSGAAYGHPPSAQRPARYGATEGARANRWAPLELHHVPGPIRRGLSSQTSDRRNAGAELRG